MGKKVRSKQKKRGSVSGSGRQICEGQQKKRGSVSGSGRQICEGQINIQDCEDQINIQDCEGQINIQDCEGQINTQEFVTQDFDCFNEDGILCSIISSLTLREAVRTSVLSHRWKHIWIYLPKLNFNHENILDSKTLELYESSINGKERFYLLWGKTDYFIQTVDAVLQQHQGRARVVEFHIQYFLYKAHSNHLDAWVRFAVESKAKILCLNLSQPHSKFKNVEQYDFPLHLLALSAIEELYLACCNLKPPYQFDCLNRLKILVMFDPVGTGEDINNLVSQCSSLDRLDVVGSKELTILNIPHSLSKLFGLTVEECDHLKEIRINAVNLEYIGYKGVPVDFVLRQPSCIQEARINFKAEGTDYDLNFYLAKLAKDLPHLDFLTLNIDGVSKVENLSKCSPSFIHLKRLEWESVGVKMSLLDLDTLLDAAPILEELQLHLSTCGDEGPPPRITKLKKKLPKNPRPHLKLIEIIGFYFERWQVQIVLYLLKNAVELESMELEKGGKPGKEINETDMKSLTQQVPPNVKFVIL